MPQFLSSPPLLIRIGFNDFLMRDVISCTEKFSLLRLIDVNLGNLIASIIDVGQGQSKVHRLFPQQRSFGLIN